MFCHDAEQKVEWLLRAVCLPAVWFLQCVFCYRGTSAPWDYSRNSVSKVKADSSLNFKEDCSTKLHCVQGYGAKMKHWPRGLQLPIHFKQGTHLCQGHCFANLGPFHSKWCPHIPQFHLTLTWLSCVSVFGFCWYSCSSTLIHLSPLWNCDEWLLHSCDLRICLHWTTNEQG